MEHGKQNSYVHPHCSWCLDTAVRSRSVCSVSFQEIMTAVHLWVHWTGKTCMGTNAGPKSLLDWPAWVVLWVKVNSFFHFLRLHYLFSLAVKSAMTCIDCPDSASQLLSHISSISTMTVVIEYLPTLWTLNNN